MTDEVKELLESNNVKVDEALERFMGNEAMYIRFLHKFIDDENFAGMKKYIDEGNAEEAFSCAHTLKGVAGNLSLEGILKDIVPLVEILRAGKLDGAKELCDSVEKTLAQLVETINSIDIE